MDSNTNSIVSVANNHNKSDAKKLRLDEAHQKFPNYDTVYGSSKNSIFVNLCTESSAKICDEDNREIFNGFAKQGGWILLVKNN